MSIDLNLTTDDIDVLKNGDKTPCTAGPVMRRTGWTGGTWVHYVPNDDNVSEFTVEKSNGVYVAGFVLYGSENYADARQSTYRNFTSYQNTGALASASGAAVLTLVNGGARILFKNFETTALAVNGQRNAGPITYNLNDPLKISENGLLCNDPDANLNAALGVDPTVVGICCKVPGTDGKLGLDLKY